MGSWVWRKLLHLRHKAKKLYKPLVGNGKFLSFWYDNWSDLGCLFDVLGRRGFIDLGIPSKSTLFETISTHQSRNHRCDYLNTIENRLQLLRSQIQQTNEEDKILWRNSSTKYLNLFSARITWTHTRDRRLILVWHKLIWFNHATPKFAFCTWLAFQDKLSTGDRKYMWNNGADSKCWLCQTEDESRNHLFFDCVYSKQVWRTVMGSLLGVTHTSSWGSLLQFMLAYQGSTIRFFLVRYVLQSWLYHIWRERINRKHGQSHITARLLSKFIAKTIQNNLSAIQRVGDSKYNAGRITWFSSR